METHKWINLLQFTLNFPFFFLLIGSKKLNSSKRLQQDISYEFLQVTPSSWSQTRQKTPVQLFSSFFFTSYSFNDSPNQEKRNPPQHLSQKSIPNYSHQITHSLVLHQFINLFDRHSHYALDSTQKLYICQAQIHHLQNQTTMCGYIVRLSVLHVLNKH